MKNANELRAMVEANLAKKVEERKAKAVAFCKEQSKKMEELANKGINVYKVECQYSLVGDAVEYLEQLGYRVNETRLDYSIVSLTIIW